MTDIEYKKMINDVGNILDKYGFNMISISSSNIRIKKNKSFTRCVRCGRQLKSSEAKERGYGKVCWEKHLADKQTLLF